LSKGTAVRELDDFEDELIEQFRRHPILQNLGQLGEADFLDILLQRRFLSLTFAAAYDLAIDLLTDEQGLEIARVILREEYPDASGQVPSHRELLKEDLFALGVTRNALVTSRPAEATMRAIARTLRLIAEAGEGEHANVRLLTILRFWGEVLVSVEYGQLWRRMASRLTTADGGNRSVFYHPHYVHDAKAHPLATAAAGRATHSDQLGLRLWQLVGLPGARDCFMRTEQAVLVVKEDFYDQFTHRLSSPAPAAGR
jgi:hypothetical protein